MARITVSRVTRKAGPGRAVADRRTGTATSSAATDDRRPTLRTGRPQRRRRPEVVSVMLGGLVEVLRRRGHVLLDDGDSSGHVPALDGVDDGGVPVAGHHRRLPGRAV